MTIHIVFEDGSVADLDNVYSAEIQALNEQHQALKKDKIDYVSYNNWKNARFNGEVD